MTFREITLQNEIGLQTSERPAIRNFLASQSPIMKVWFVIMLANLAMFLFILR